MENQAAWHGVAPNREQFEKAITELATPAVPRERIDRMISRAGENARRVAEETRSRLPLAGHDYWWNTRETMKVEMDSTRMGFGRGLEAAGADDRVCTIQADISGSIRISDFAAKHPERIPRVISVGIAEQDMMGVAAGIAKEGFIPVTGTYGVFAAGRAWDQLRTTVCFNNLNVKIAGAHGGISVGPDGATHQSLEEISLMSILPNMHLVAPCDSMEVEKSTRHCLLEIHGPVYLSFAREATPIVTKPETPYHFGVANIIRFAGGITPIHRRFRDQERSRAITKRSAKTHRSWLAARWCRRRCVPAWLLKEDYGIETRVINMHTIKPLDSEALVAAAAETQLVLTVEEHQKGGFGNLVAGAILRERKDFARPLCST